MSPFVTFSLIPILFALIAGFSTSEIQTFFLAGLDKVTPIAVMFIFAILFFAFMQERGLFDPMIQSIVSKAGDHLIAVTAATVAISILAHLDGSGASTFLICIPTLLPVYQRLQMSPYLLLLLVSASASVMNMLPWGGPLGRAATVIEVDPTQLWYALIPIQGSAVILLFLGAYLLGIREQHRIKERSLLKTSTEQIVGGSGENVEGGERSEDSEDSEDQASQLPTYWWTNLCLTLSMITLLLSGIFPSALVFIIALSIALILNRQTVDEQHAFMKRHAWSALHMAMIIFAAGIFLGVLKESKMLHALAQDSMSYLPEMIQAHIHILIGFFGAPFELILNTDVYYYALFFIVEQAVQPYAVSSESVVYAMLIGNIIGTFISPFSPALWLALGLARLDMDSHIRYSFKWIWGLSIILMLIAWILGLF
jgi:CitMHS family citrate-Mg2+:H+ or citrate-Ca2+:H+ symporter